MLADDPRFAMQGYLQATDRGIDAEYARGFGEGDGIQFIDIEGGWRLDHEDLAAAGIALLSGLNVEDPAHGTAVLGGGGRSHHVEADAPLLTSA